MINESLVAKQGTLATIETPPQMLVGKFRHFTPTGDRKSTRLNSSHANESRMPSSA